MTTRGVRVVGVLGPVVVSSALALACSSGSSPSPPSAAGAGEGGSPIANGDDGTRPASTDDLTGTWDIIASHPGSQTETGVVVLGRHVFSMTLGRTTLAYRTDDVGGAAPLVTSSWTSPYSHRTINVVHDAAALSTGILPFDLGGQWTFTGADRASDSAQLTAAADAFSLVWWNAEWPLNPPVPAPRDAKLYTIRRASEAASAFGALGGVWQGVDDEGGPGHCTATFQGNTFAFSASSDRDAPYEGVITMTFEGGIGSGSVTGGSEISARRR